MTEREYRAYRRRCREKRQRDLALAALGALVFFLLVNFFK